MHVGHMYIFFRELSIQVLYPFLVGLSFFLIFIHLFLAALDLSCSTRDLLLQHVGSSLQHAGFSLVVVCGLLSSCGVWAPEHTGSLVVAHRLQSTWAL